MKTKSFLASILILSLSFVLHSCGLDQGPDVWETEIEDAFKIQVALAFDYAIYDEDAVDELAELIDNTADKKAEEYSLSKTDIAKYKLALEELAPNNAGAAELLKLYNSIEPHFTEWEKCPKEDGYSIWKSTEQVTEIKVTFKNNKALDWDLELEEESFAKFITDWVQTALEALGLNNMPNENTESILIGLAKKAYSGKIEDEKILTKRLCEDLHCAIALDGDVDSWANIGYWKYSDGHQHRFQIKGCELEGIYAPYVLVSLPDAEIKTVALCFKKEVDNWLIDDIIGYENGVVTSSISDYATVACAEADHEGNDFIE